MDGKKIQELWRQHTGAIRRIAGQTLGKMNHESGSALLSRAVRLSGLAVIGFILAGGELAFGARPMGTALLACIPDGGACVAFGMILRALIEGDGAWIGITVAVGIWLLRAFGAQMLPKRFEDEDRFREGAALQVTLGCAAATAGGIWTLIRGGFLFHDLFGMLIAIAAQPPLILAYRWAFESDSRYSMRAECGQAILAMSVLLALTPLKILGFSLATAAGYFLTLYVAITGGVLRGGIAGFLFGFICEPILAPVMGLGGLTAGLFREKGVTIATMTALAVSVACDFYAEGTSAMLSPTPDLILGLVAALPILRMPKIPRIFTYAASAEIPGLLLARGTVAESAEKESRARLSALTESMESLSEVFYHLSDRMKKPGASEVRSLCDKCFRKHCVRCSLTTVCWVREQASTADALTLMTAAICREGILSLSDVPDYLSDRCKNITRIVSDINNAHIDTLEQATRQDKLEVLALDYRAMSELLSHACRIHAAETEPDPVLTRRLKQTVACMGIGTACLTVVGKRRLSVIAGGVDPGQIRLSPNRIREAFGDTLGVNLTPPTFDYEGGYVTMSLSTARRFRVESAKAGCEKEKEAVSGDSVAIFENREDYCYALISDGMGSGREAALTSRMCTVFLRTMLAAGNPKSVAIEMLNNFIRNKNLECFATVDLLEIDLLSGHACFVKSGAAPSYVLRDGKLFRISSHTMPIGITREIRAEEIRFELEAGDIVVIMSDGVASDSIPCDPFPGDPSSIPTSPAAGIGASLWLADMLTFDWKEDDTIRTMCEKILRTAQELNHRADDMTVAMIRIEDAAEADQEITS